MSGFCILYAVLGATRLIVFFTRFCGHIFGCLIVCLFFQQTIQGTYREFSLYGPIDGMWSVVVAFLLPLTALALTQLKYADDFLTKSIRMFLSDYAAAIVVVLFTILSTALPEYGLHGLPHKVDSHQTFGDSFLVINEMMALPFSARMLAAFPGFSISILFFFDHTVSSQLAQTGDDLIVTKPSTYAYDLMLLGILTACLGLLGFPPVNGVIPQAPLHARALRGLAADHEKRTAASSKEHDSSAEPDSGNCSPRQRRLSMQERGEEWQQGDDDDELPSTVPYMPPTLSRQSSDQRQLLKSPRNPPKSAMAMAPSEIEIAQETARKLLDEKLVLEQRGSNFVQALLCGCLVPAAPITGLLPTSVLWGYFAFMALDAAMANNNLIFRFILFFRSEKSRNEMIEKASWKDIGAGIIDRYTCIQLIILFIIWSMTFWGSDFVWLGIMFPLPIVALLPLRQLLLPWLLGSDNIESLDPMSVGNAANEHGLTLLHAAAWSGNIAFVTQFLEQKHGYDTVDQKLRSPLHCACWSPSEHSFAIARLLIDAGADVNLADKDGATPLLVAAAIDRQDIVRLLVLLGGAELNIQDAEGSTPLMKAIGKGDRKTVSFLLEKGADARLVDVNDISPLHIAAERGKESIVKILIENSNIDIDWVAKNGRTALHLAAKNDRVKVAKLLVAAKAKLDIQDGQQKTPLHASAELKDRGMEMCDLLVKAGADPSIAADGDTALDLMGEQKRLNFLSKWVLEHYQKKDFRKLYKKMEEHHFALWFAVVKVEEPKTNKGAQEFKHLRTFVHDITTIHGWKVAEEAKDAQGRPAIESASKAMRDTMEKVLLWHGRYKLDKKPVAEHNSPTYDLSCILPSPETVKHSSLH